MIYLILFIIGALLYFDNISSAINGGFADRGPFHVLFVAFVVLLLFVCVFCKNKLGKIHVNKLVYYLLSLVIVIAISDIMKGSSIVGDLRVLYTCAWMVVIVTFENLFLYCSEKQVNRFLVGMAVLFLFSVYNSYTTLSYMMNDVNRIVMPCIYISAMFLPWLLVLKNKYFKPLLLVTMIGIVALSAKRGAIIAVFVALLVYYYKVTKLEKGHGSILKILGISLVCIVILLFVDAQMGGAILSRFSEEAFLDGSGRGASNSAVIYAVTNYASISDMLFGFSNVTISQMEDFLGHNDWFGFLVNNGIIGVCFFALFMFRVFRGSFHSDNAKIAPAYAALFAMMFLQSLYSTTINPTIHPLFAMMFIGYAESVIKKDQLQVFCYE